MARQTLLSNYVKSLTTESPDAAGPATPHFSAPAPARKASVGSAREEGPVGGQEGAASQPVKLRWFIGSSGPVRNR